MEADIADIARDVAEAATRLPQRLDTWVLVQLGAIVVAAILAMLLARRFAPAVEEMARSIKGNPDLLRLAIAFMRRLRWLFAIVMLWIVRFALERLAHDSDPHAVSRLAIETAETIERVAAYREPVCWLTAFGPSSLDFKLRFWISDPRSGLTNVRGQVLIALWDAFKAAGISIPFPHREIFMRTPVELVGGGRPSGAAAAGRSAVDPHSS